MHFTEGKNYKVTNEFSISHILINPYLGEKMSMQIYGKFDLLVDGEITESPKDFWVICRDLDETTFAQPMDATILAEKIMGGGWLPLKVYKQLEGYLKNDKILKNI